MNLAELLPRLGNVRKSGDGVMARCPAHDDKANSLSVGEAEDKILLHCFAGCPPERIVGTLGLEMKDLFRNRNGNRARRSPVTLSALAQDKGLPYAVLRGFGLYDQSGGVGIPYRDTAGRPVQTKRRTALSAKDGSFWQKGAPLMAYGLDRLHEARERGELVLVEGESDCWTLWHHGLPALGIPGASATKVLQAAHLEGINRLYVVQETDQGGLNFVEGVRSRLKEIGYRGEASVLKMPDGLKDVNDLHRADPSAFKERFRAAMENATPLEAQAAEVERKAEHATPVPSGPAPRLADVLDEIAEIILRFVKLPYDSLAVLVAVWIVNTYAFMVFSYCGYLAPRSPTPRCGKSRLLKIVAMFSNGNPPVTANPSAASLFRSGRPVLILDEVDRLRNADKETFMEVIATLNFGFERGGVVERVEKTKGGFVVKAYPVYGPKALAGIEGLADTLADRAFHIEMQRTPKRMPRLNARRMQETAERIRGGLAAWAAGNEGTLTEVYDGLPDELPHLAGMDDRLQDIAEPLVILASLADSERADGPKVLPRLLDALKAAAGRREPSNRERELGALLEIIREKMDAAVEVFITSSDLLAECQGREDLSRIETGRALAGLLRRFDLAPHAASGKVRGYTVRREWVEEWAGRYGQKGGEGAS